MLDSGRNDNFTVPSFLKIRPKKESVKFGKPNFLEELTFFIPFLTWLGSTDVFSTHGRFKHEVPIEKLDQAVRWSSSVLEKQAKLEPCYFEKQVQAAILGAFTRH